MRFQQNCINNRSLPHRPNYLSAMSWQSPVTREKWWVAAGGCWQSFEVIGWKEGAAPKTSLQLLCSLADYYMSHSLCKKKKTLNVCQHSPFAFLAVVKLEKMWHKVEMEKNHSKHKWFASALQPTHFKRLSFYVEGERPLLPLCITAWRVRCVCLQTSWHLPCKPMVTMTFSEAYLTDRSLGLHDCSLSLFDPLLAKLWGLSVFLWFLSEWVIQKVKFSTLIAEAFWL